MRCVLPVVTLGLSAMTACVPTRDDGAVNAVVEDVSFLERFGRWPTPKDDETLRIRTHLEWVERELRRREVPGLSAAQAARRERLLDVLGEYRERGEFPRHDEKAGAGRAPRFIDGAGRICAVGRLVEITSGRTTAEAIAAEHEYDFMMDMRSPRVTGWIASSGFTRRELAMIQPTYGFRPRPKPSGEEIRKAAQRLLAQSERVIGRCARAAGVSAEVRVRLSAVLDRGKVRASARAVPRSPRLEGCAEEVVRRTLASIARRARQVRVRRVLRVPAVSPAPQPTEPPPAPPSASVVVSSRVKGALDMRRGMLRACFADGSPGRLTMWIVVEPDGRLWLRSVRVPRGSEAGWLPCVASVIRRTPAAVRPQARMRVDYVLEPSEVTRGPGGSPCVRSSSSGGPTRSSRCRPPRTQDTSG